MEGYRMTLKNLIDEEMDVKAAMMQIQQLQQLDKSNASTAQMLKNNPELAKQFQPFQTLVQQQLKQKQLEAQQAQAQQQQAQQAQQPTRMQPQQTATPQTTAQSGQQTTGVAANQQHLKR